MDGVQFWHRGHPSRYRLACSARCGAPRPGLALFFWIFKTRFGFEGQVIVQVIIGSVSVAAFTLWSELSTVVKEKTEVPPALRRTGCRDLPFQSVRFRFCFACLPEIFLQRNATRGIEAGYRGECRETEHGRSALRLRDLKKPPRPGPRRPALNTSSQTVPRRWGRGRHGVSWRHKAPGQHYRPLRIGLG